MKQNSKSPVGTADDKSTKDDAAFRQAQLEQNPMLCDVYPNWLYIEPISNKLLMYILKEYGTLNKEDYERVYKKYVLPYFTTWDNFSCCMNGDVQYSPVVLAWYAEKIGVKPTYPLRVMRQVAWSLRNIA